MQFGKFHGWAFLALGAFLIAVQIGLFLVPNRGAQVSSPSPEGSAKIHKTSTVPAVLGGLSLAVGFALFLANRRQSQQ